MKKKYPFLSLILSIVSMILPGCRQETGLWPQMPYEIEQICDSLEYLYQHDRIRQGAGLISQLESETAAETDANRKARVLYWKGMTGGDSAAIWLHRARELADSSEYPYMVARIILEDSQFDHSTFLRRHSELRNAIMVFNKSKDEMMELFGYRALSSFYLHLGDYDKFKETAREISEVCERIGNDTLKAKNNINYVMSYTHEGDTLKAKRLLNELLRNRYIISDSDFMGRLYVNLGNLSSDPENYRKAIEISPTFRSTPHLRQTLEFAMMKTYEANGDTQHADSMLSRLQPIVEKEGDYSAKSIMHSMLSRKARQYGNYKVALEESEAAKRYADSTFSPEERMKVTQISFKDEIAKQEEQYERERQLAQTRWLAAIAMLVLACLSIWFYFKIRQNRMRLRQLASEAEVAKLNLDLEKEKRTIAALGLAMTERDNLIKDVIKIADQMHEEGAISTDAKMTIGRMVKLSQMSQQEWDNFQIAYTRVHPHFIRKLKETYPGISEGDTRLALYICAGLTSKQIVQAMHLQPDSIKKNRQRLRQRMKLTSDVSLEETLREML